MAANSLILTWSASTGTAPITYQPLFRVAGGSAFLPFGSPISGLSVTVTGLVASTSYDFEVTAINAFGSATSTISTGTTSSGNAFPAPGNVAGTQSTGSTAPIITGPQNGAAFLNTALAVTGLTITDTSATSGTLVVGCTSGSVGMTLNGVPVTSGSSATTFADEFTSIPLHQPWQAGDKWQLIAPDTQTGRGGPNFGEAGTQWWVNPLNANTPNATMYTVVNGQLQLQIQPTPSGSQTYINTQSGTSLPYEGALLNSSPTSYQKFGYYEFAVAVNRVNGFGWLFSLENVQITGHWPPEIDLLISTDGSNVQTVQFKINITGGSQVYSISTNTGFNASVKHVYGIDWQTDAITLYIDGSQMYRVANPGGVYQTDQQFIFLATYANYPSGVNPAAASLPASASIDYIRVYQTKPPPVSALTLTDTFANIKAALASLIYIAPGSPTVDTISVKFTDQTGATNTLLIQIQDVAQSGSVAPSAPTNLAATNASPTGSSVVTKQTVLAFINSIIGTHTISCQFIECGPLDPVTAIHTKTGKWLGMLGGDYFHFNSGQGSTVTSFNPIAINYWNAGGLITLSCHMPNPGSGGGVQDGQACNFSQLLTTGNSTNTNFVATLNQIAAGLQQLQDAGVVVIFRPFHELNGNWFWWGTQNCTDAQFIAAWKYTHDYFVNTKGLTNLLWLYCVNAGTGSLTARWPGSAYADLSGQDLYTNNPSDGNSSYNTLLTLGVPTSMSEFGAGTPGLGNTSFDMQTLVNTFKTSMPKSFMWQQWWDGNGGNTGWGMAETNQNTITAALSDPWVLNRGDFSIGSLATANSVMQLTWSGSTGTAPILYQPLYKLHTDATFTASGPPVSGLITTISGLYTNTSYDFEVTASNSVGSATSAIVTASTTNATSAPSAPSGLQTQSTSNTSLTVSWSPSSGTSPITYQPLFRPSSPIAAGTRLWYQVIGGDRTMITTPFQTTATWITSGPLIDQLRALTFASVRSDATTGFVSPFWVSQSASDVLCTFHDSTNTIADFQMRVPAGAHGENGSTGAGDNSAGFIDASRPYKYVTMNDCRVGSSASNASASGVVSPTNNFIMCGPGFGSPGGMIVQDATGPTLMDAVNGSITPNIWENGDNVSGCITYYDLQQCVADANYVIQHLIGVNLGLNVFSSAQRLWPLVIGDVGGAGSIPEGCIIGIPANVARPTGRSRGFNALFDLFQHFGGMFNNVTTNGQIGIKTMPGDTATTALVADMNSQFISVLPYLSILNFTPGMAGAQYGVSTLKGRLAGATAWSDAFPAPPTLTFAQTNNATVLPSTFGAWQAANGLGQVYNTIWPGNLASLPFVAFGSPISGTSVTITGLSPNTSYDIEIVAINPIGQATSAAVTSTTGLLGVPSDATGTQAKPAQDMLNRFGINTHFGNGLYSGIAPAQAVAALQSIGVTLIRDSDNG